MSALRETIEAEAREFFSTHITSTIHEMERAMVCKMLGSYAAGMSSVLGKLRDHPQVQEIMDAERARYECLKAEVVSK